MLTGPRGAGKTTLVKRVAKDIGAEYASLDDEASLAALRFDAPGFLDRRKPLVIDEYQRGGDHLILAIKCRVDADQRRGRFLLAGSADFLAIPTISESLAGRVGLVDIGPLTVGERRGVRERFVDRLFGAREDLLAMRTERLDRRQVLSLVAEGGFPAALRGGASGRMRAHRAIARTATSHDIPDFVRAHGPRRHAALLELLAKGTGEELNLSSVAATLGVARRTALECVRHLEIVGLVARAYSWGRTAGTRVVRHAAVHLVDSGLAVALTRTRPRDLLEPGHPMAQPLLETFVAGQLRSQVSWSRALRYLWHFRHHDRGSRVLVVLGPDLRVVGVEVRATASLPRGTFDGLRALADVAGDKFVNGVVLYLGGQALPWGDRLCALPVSALWAP